MEEDQVWQIVRFPQSNTAFDRRAAAGWLMERIRKRITEFPGRDPPADRGAEGG